MSHSPTSKVLLDSNSLIYSIKQRVDLRDLLFALPEISGILVPECVLMELRSMSGDVLYAKGAFDLASRFPSTEGVGPADDCILRIASDKGLFILTNDRELLSRARELGVRTLTFKGRKRIEFS